MNKVKYKRVTCGTSPGVLGTVSKQGVGPVPLLSRLGAGELCGTAKCSGLLFLVTGSWRFARNFRSANK